MLFESKCLRKYLLWRKDSCQPWFPEEVGVQATTYVLPSLVRQKVNFLRTLGPAGPALGRVLRWHYLGIHHLLPDHFCTRSCELCPSDIVRLTCERYPCANNELASS